MQESQVLEVSYGQISVFDAATSTPFSLWEDRHVHQGFTWREGAVGFRTMAENGPFHVTLTEGSTGVSESSVLLVDVPFLSRSGKVVVASVADEFEVRIAAGSYQLRYGCSADHRIVLDWTQCIKPVFRVTRSDRPIPNDSDLLLVAHPAL